MLQRLNSRVSQLFGRHVWHKAGPSTLTTDQRGVPFARILDGDHVGGAVVDIGAFESPGIRVISPNPNAFSLRPAFAWTAIAGATSYDIQINNESTGVAQFHLGSATGTSYTPSVDLAIGKFKMWVRPVFAGSLGNWSAPHLFNNLSLARWHPMPRTQLTYHTFGTVNHPRRLSPLIHSDCLCRWFRLRFFRILKRPVPNSLSRIWIC